MRALYTGVLGRARSRSIGTEGAEALPRWDPRLAALVGLEHEVWGALELVSSRSRSNARALVIPDCQSEAPVRTLRVSVLEPLISRAFAGRH
jgi:hypothetical protein